MIGETLLVLQRFERFLVAVLMMMSTPEHADRQLRSALLRDKATLGGLIAFFAERVELPEHFASTFDGLLKRRNILVHSLFMETWFDLSSAQGQGRLDSFLAEIRSAAKLAVHVMLSAISACTLRSEELEVRNYVDRITSRIRQTAEPDFGGLTEDQYTAKVLKNARDQFSVEPRKK